MRRVRRVSILVLIPLLLLSLPATGCATRRSTSYARDQLVGVVYTDDGAPLAGAEIRVGLVRRGVSDAFGRFRIDQVPAGEQVITVSARGYEQVEQTVQLQNRTHLVRVDLVSLAGLTDLAIAAAEQGYRARVASIANRMEQVDPADLRTTLVRRLVDAYEQD